MRTINIHEAKPTSPGLSIKRRRASQFVIAKAGKPLVKVVPSECPEADWTKRLGFLEGQIRVPDDFDQMGQAEIDRLCS